MRDASTRLKWWIWIFALLCSALPACAQGNYEIQVYGADTIEPKSTMVELHSNYTLDGEKNMIDGVYPTNHQEHETLEITQGLTSWSEVGFYVFTSVQNGHGVQWVGDHIRPQGARAGFVALAGGRQPVDGGRLSAAGVFARYLDVGDTADHRQIRRVAGTWP